MIIDWTEARDCCATPAIGGSRAVLLRSLQLTDGWRTSNLQISDQLLCLFNAEVVEEEGTFHVTIPAREVEQGVLSPGNSYRVAVIEPKSEEAEETERPKAPSGPQPPVEVGEVRYVEIEDIGKQGDGIARVERGYVIIVPGTDIGEQVKIEVTDVKSNFAVAEVVEDQVI